MAGRRGCVQTCTQSTCHTNNRIPCVGFILKTVESTCYTPSTLSFERARDAKIPLRDADIQGANETPRGLLCLVYCAGGRSYAFLQFCIYLQHY